MKYVPPGGRPGFLEAADLDDLRWTAGSGPVAIRMRNEALETHAVRSLRLHAVAEPRGHLASVERGEGGQAERIREVMSLLGRIEVRVLDSDGKWRTAGVLDEAGPLASDLHLIELPAAGGPAPVRMQLELTQGFPPGYLPVQRTDSLPSRENP